MYHVFKIDVDENKLAYKLNMTKEELFEELYKDHVRSFSFVKELFDDDYYPPYPPYEYEEKEYPYDYFSWQFEDYWKICLQELKEFFSEYVILKSEDNQVKEIPLEDFDIKKTGFIRYCYKLYSAYFY